MQFSSELVRKTQALFEKKYAKRLSGEETQEILATLAELGSLFAKNIDVLTRKDGNPRISKESDNAK